MIIDCKYENIEELVEISWEVLCDRKKSSFPRLKSYDEMYSEFLKLYTDKDDKLLVCQEDGEILGTISLFVKKSDKYLQGRILAKKNFNLVATQFIEYIRDNYSGYEIDLGYPFENEEAIDFLERSNARLMDSCITMELKKEDFIKLSNYDDVITLDKSNYSEYSAFHDKHNPNMYWTSERIFRNIDIWSIYIIIEREKIVGSIFIKSKGNNPEVFGISVGEEYKNKGLELKLLSQSIDNMFIQGKKEILYFVEEDAIEEIEATLKIGFKQVDTYRCYKMYL